MDSGKTALVETCVDGDIIHGSPPYCHPAIPIHSDEGLTLETSVFESFKVANLPHRPCG